MYAGRGQRSECSGQEFRAGVSEHGPHYPAVAQRLEKQSDLGRNESEQHQKIFP